MTWKPVVNPSDAEIRAMIEGSKFRAARRIVDPRSGDAWLWPAEQATHAEGARRLGVPYDRPPGTGDILVDD